MLASSYVVEPAPVRQNASIVERKSDGNNCHNGWRMIRSLRVERAGAICLVAVCNVSKGLASFVWSQSLGVERAGGICLVAVSWCRKGWCHLFGRSLFVSKGLAVFVWSLSCVLHGGMVVCSLAPLLEG